MPNASLQTPRKQASDCGPLGGSRVQRHLRELISQVADFDTLVLIQGESGSGKEVVARAIHNASNRRDKPFIPVNCGAIPADLLESELFGHEKGSFTGAISSRKGRFEMAEGGTLFLDEIGDMSLPMQVKLLRVLQEKCFERVGSNQTIHCNVRIVAATHRDLASMIEDGRFRHDLYYRLNVFPITVPSLREHLTDLPELITHLLGRFSAKNMAVPRFTSTAIESMQAYHWPGNIRELENLLERLCITHGGKLVSGKNLPAPFNTAIASGEDDEEEDEISFLLRRDDNDEDWAELDSEPSHSGIDLPDQGFNLKDHMQDLEKQFIFEALQRTNGTVTQAAKLLGLQRTTLAEKMKKLNMT